VVDEFYEASGNRLNLEKCHFYGWNVTQSDLNSIARCWGFGGSMHWTSFKYLGLPIFQKNPTSKDWTPIIDKFKNKMQAWGFSWLNIAGKTVLIKSVLNSLPIYQASLMLAPLGTLRKMEGYVRNFFWKGGKQNRDRLPLVNWDKVTKPLLEGGLNFKDMRTHNLALGTKILWRQIAPKAGWAQRALWKKYFMGPRKCCLDNPVKVTNGSQIHKLCMQAHALIQDNLYWILGNGKIIKIWEDRIMNEDPLADVQELQELRLWMKNAGLAFLWDISVWKENVWLEWRKPNLPSNLENAWLNLCAKLKGKAPAHEKKIDQRGLGAALQCIHCGTRL
jgi:hypothetical protein